MIGKILTKRSPKWAGTSLPQGTRGAGGTLQSCGHRLRG